MDDAFTFGVLSSRIHIVWALATGGTLEDRPRYNKTVCFETFPFPTTSEVVKAKISQIAEAIDAHRKQQQSLYADLTITGIYNVLEKLRSKTPRPLDGNEQDIHAKGLVSVLQQLHDDLDVAVAEAYGIDPKAKDEEILTFLCKLNAERAAEERAGHIRWLRPSFQHPTGRSTQTALVTDSDEVVTPTKAKTTAKLPWPKTLAEQAQAVRGALATAVGPADAASLAAQFKSARVDRIAELLATLASLGQARDLHDGRYTAN